MIHTAAEFKAMRIDDTKFRPPPPLSEGDI